MLTGSLAPKGAVVKVAGLDELLFEGTARVFDGEAAAMEAIVGGSIEPGTVLVIRYEGPKGGPGMREMLAVTGALEGAGLGVATARSSPTAGSAAAPTASVSATWPPRPSTAAPSPSWPTATASRSMSHRHSIDLLVADAELDRRRGELKAFEPRYTTGVLAKYARLVTGAERGAVTEP